MESVADAGCIITKASDREWRSNVYDVYWKSMVSLFGSLRYWTRSAKTNTSSRNQTEPSSARACSPLGDM